MGSDSLPSLDQRKHGLRPFLTNKDRLKTGLDIVWGHISNIKKWLRPRLKTIQNILPWPRFDLDSVFHLCIALIIWCLHYIIWWQYQFVLSTIVLRLPRHVLIEGKSGQQASLEEKIGLKYAFL